MPTDFNRTGSAACASRQQLQTVDLSQADVLEILGSAFAHCSQLQQLGLSRNLRITEQEAFLKCTSLQEVSTSPSLEASVGLGGYGALSVPTLVKERHSSNTLVPKCLQPGATTARSIWHQRKAPCNGLTTVSGTWTICNCRQLLHAASPTVLTPLSTSA